SARAISRRCSNRSSSTRSAAASSPPRPPRRADDDAHREADSTRSRPLARRPGRLTGVAGMAVLVAPVGRRIGLSALALVLCAGAGPADRARAAPVAAPPAVAIELRPLGTAEAIDALEVR